MKENKSFIQKLTENPIQLFFIDALGALLSIFLLGFVLVMLYPYIGMPVEKLYYLSLAPCVFAVYSYLCYVRKPKSWKKLLAIIAIANLVYCIITFSLLFSEKETLTTLGYLYFIGEIVVILGLVAIELKLALSKTPATKIQGSQQIKKYSDEKNDM